MKTLNIQNEEKIGKTEQKAIYGGSVFSECMEPCLEQGQPVAVCINDCRS